MGTDAHAFSSGQDALSKSPFDPSRTWQAWMPAKRTRWGALSFGYFSLGTQRKVTRSLRDRKRRRQYHTHAQCWVLADTHLQSTLG
jgi:hypothetical protein